MEYRIIIAGFGGQGVLFAGKILAQAAADVGFEVSWLPSYGPEMRGGTANCQVVIADRTIGSPSFRRADFLIAMNKPSLEKFAASAKTVITDASFAAESDTGVDTAGFEKLANMVMLGALAAKMNIISKQSFISVVQCTTTMDKAIKDIKAFEQGYGA